MTLLRLSSLLIFSQCFVYKRTDVGLSFDLFGLTVSPDRLIFVVILICAIWKLTCGELKFLGFGKIEWYMLLFALICTVSIFAMGTTWFLYYLFDFIYCPFVVFVLIKSIPQSTKKLETLSSAFLFVGAYLAINGTFEHFGPHALVWPQYIFDGRIGSQFERTRGSFASAEALGAALAVTFLFYALYATRAKGDKAYWAYLMLLMTAGVIYTTNQRSAWLIFAACLALLAISKSEMNRVARIFLGIVLLGFISGAATHFSFWGETLFSKRQETVDYRYVNFLTTWAMGAAHPIFGVGFGNFWMWPQYFRPVEGIGIPDLTDGNHNTFLGLFAEVGLAGLIPYLLIFYQMLRVGLRVYAAEEGINREFSVIFLLVMVGFVIGANFSDYRSGPFHNTVLFVLFGTVAAMDERRRLAAAALHDDSGVPSHAKVLEPRSRRR
jgi:putative inorganic carbon (hco3(-)) transporter